MNPCFPKVIFQNKFDIAWITYFQWLVFNTAFQIKFYDFKKHDDNDIDNNNNNNNNNNNK